MSNKKEFTTISIPKQLGAHSGIALLFMSAFSWIHAEVIMPDVKRQMEEVASQVKIELEHHTDNSIASHETRPHIGSVTEREFNPLETHIFRL